MDNGSVRKLFLMVQELHVRGYQRLRISPGMSASGVHWRCSITPVDNVSKKNGALIIDWDRGAHYFGAQGRKYFGWEDTGGVRPGQLAELFLKRFPDICAAGKGPDWEYAGWYTWMLHLTYPSALFIAYADWELPADYLEGENGLKIPLPPPGLAEGWD
jgi:hypothetical protein